VRATSAAGVAALQAAALVRRARLHEGQAAFLRCGLVALGTLPVEELALVRGWCCEAREVPWQNALALAAAAAAVPEGAYQQLLMDTLASISVRLGTCYGTLFPGRCHGMCHGTRVDLAAEGFDCRGARLQTPPAGGAQGCARAAQRSLGCRLCSECEVAWLVLGCRSRSRRRTPSSSRLRWWHADTPGCVRTLGRNSWLQLMPALQSTRSPGRFRACWRRGSLRQFNRRQPGLWRLSANRACPEECGMFPGCAWWPYVTTLM
jgi:hypothetical protein